jgi:acetyl esterase/lipase
MSEHAFVEDESILTRPAPEPDVIATWGPGPEDVGEVQLGADDKPLVMLIHGGFWRPEYDRAHLRATSHALAAAGYTTCVPEYRRVPGSPDAACEDVRVALRVLPVELRGRHDGRVVVVGHSAGGHLALWAASAAPAAGLVGTVALAPVADLATADRERVGGDAVESFLGGSASTRTDLDPTRRVSAAQPVVLVHGLEDAIVPASLSESYVAAHPSATLLTVPDAGHFDLIDPRSAAWTLVLSAIGGVAGAS